MIFVFSFGFGFNFKVVVNIIIYRISRITNFFVKIIFIIACKGIFDVTGHIFGTFPNIFGNGFGTFPQIIADFFGFMPKTFLSICYTVSYIFYSRNYNIVVR